MTSYTVVYNYELATDYNFPNINLYRRYRNGEFNGWKADTAEGYVMYDITANDKEYNPENDTQTPVIYYHTTTMMPQTYNIDKFPYVAVSRDSVDEKYIF